MEKTILGTSQHKDVVEHMNQTLTERAKSLLCSSFYQHKISLHNNLLNQLRPTRAQSTRGGMKWKVGKTLTS